MPSPTVHGMDHRTYGDQPVPTSRARITFSFSVRSPISFRRGGGSLRTRAGTATICSVRSSSGWSWMSTTSSRYRSGKCSSQMYRIISTARAERDFDASTNNRKRHFLFGAFLDGRGRRGMQMAIGVNDGGRDSRIKVRADFASQLRLRRSPKNASHPPGRPGTASAPMLTMANLRRFDLVPDASSKAWVLKEGDRVVRPFSSKEEAVAGGALARAIGEEGGSVRIHLQDGTFEEERTFPRSADPRESPG